jgi:cyclophilin family peptidyl-prolyl cis-trans isomerase
MTLVCAARCPGQDQLTPSPSRRSQGDVVITPPRAYARIHGPVRIDVSIPSVARGQRLEIALLSADGATTIFKAPLPSGEADLASIFPSFWDAESPGLCYAQALANSRPIGAPLVIEPLLTRPGYVDGWSAQVLAAFERRDEDALRVLMSLGEGARADLRASAEPRGSAAAIIWSGARVYVDHRVVLKTSAGDITLELRPDAAPATAYRFLSLVRDGYYDGTSFHRVIAEDSRGRPYLIQAGDPTATGAGGSGERFPFEASTLGHDFGVVSMARHPADPNSASGQFFICLSREACASLDGRYTAFARVIGGAEVVRTIAAAPVGPSRPDDPRSAVDRPLELVTIEGVILVPAPPLARTDPASQEPEKVER